MLSKKLSLLVLPLVATLSLHASNPFDDPFFNDPFGDDIFKEMMQMQKEMDQIFQRMHERRQQRSTRLISPLGTYKMANTNQFTDKGNTYILNTNIPESKENHIDIKTENGVMSITAKIIQKTETKTQGMISQSSSVRMYQQALPLPQDADESAISTSYVNGKLQISIAKKNSTVQNKHASAVKVLSTPKETKKAVSKNTVPITNEFDQTPKSKSKESNSTIKKELIHSDNNSMI